MATDTPNLHLKKPALSDRVADTIGTDIPSAFDIIDGLMPPGIVLQFTNGANPNQLFPGTTWTQLHDVFLVASGSQFAAGSSGGTSTHHHIMPMGFDGKTIYYHKAGDGNPAFGSEVYLDSGYTAAVEYQNQGNLRDAYTKDANNLPPYKVVNMWERTS